MTGTQNLMDNVDKLVSSKKKKRNETNNPPKPNAGIQKPK